MFSLVRRRLVRPTLAVRTFSAQPSAPPSLLSKGEQHIYTKLREKFAPTELMVEDVSGGCGTSYAIYIASEAFKGLPIIKQHRMVNEVLKQDLESIHALQLKTETPTQ